MTLSDIRSLFRDPTPAELQLIARYAELKDDPRRQRAFEAFAKTGLPHRRMEQWKWTDFRQGLPSIEPAAEQTVRKLEAPAGAVVITFDGESWTVPEQLPDGLHVFEKTEAQALGGAETMPIAALTASLTGKSPSTDLLQFEVTSKIDTPLFIDFGGAGEAAFSRLAFVVRPEASINLIELHRSTSGFSSSMLEFGLQEGAALSRTLLQDNGKDAASAITATATLAQNASLTQTALAFGSKVSRIETRISYDGPDAKAVLNAAYLPRAGRHVDLTSHVRHGAHSCVTRQLTKGAISKGGRGVFQGKFHVPRTVGQYTDADMQHQALLLEEGAEVFAKPELEIYADDVECAHGNTSGQLDESALFYMRQRGLPLSEARALLTQAFVVEALETAHPGVRDQLIELSRSFLDKEA